MKCRALFISLIACALATAAHAQTGFVQVTATVVDPQGFPYSNGTVSADLIPDATNPTVNGTPFSGHLGPAQLDLNGTFNMTLADNNLVQPSGTQWQFRVCANLATVQWPVGRGSQCFALIMTITGTTQNITTNLNAIATSLTNVCPNANITPPSPITCGSGGGSGCDISGTTSTESIFNNAGACAGDPLYLWLPNGVHGLYVGQQESTLPAFMQGFYSEDPPSFPTTFEVVGNSPNTGFFSAIFLSHNNGAGVAFQNFQDANATGSQTLEVDAYTGGSATVGETIGIDLAVQSAETSTCTLCENLKIEWGAQHGSTVTTARAITIQPPAVGTSGGTLANAVAIQIQGYQNGVSEFNGMSIQSTVDSTHKFPAIVLGNAFAEDTPGACGIFYGGLVTPNGNVSAAPCSLYLYTGGGAGATFWVKESGTGNTGWVAK